MALTMTNSEAIAIVLILSRPGTAARPEVILLEGYIKVIFLENSPGLQQRRQAHSSRGQGHPT